MHQRRNPRLSEPKNSSSLVKGIVLPLLKFLLIAREMLFDKAIQNSGPLVFPVTGLPELIVGHGPFDSLYLSRLQMFLQSHCIIPLEQSVKEFTLWWV